MCFVPDVVVVADVEGSVGAGRHGPHAQDGRLLGQPVAARGVATVEIVKIDKKVMLGQMQKLL